MALDHHRITAFNGGTAAMKFALAGYGSRGDVEPLAALGRELLRRGHDVCVAITPTMVRFVESVGIAAVAYGPDLQAMGDEDFDRNATIQYPVSSMVQALERLSHSIAERGATLTALANGADLLLALPDEQWLHANVAEYYGIPLVALHLFPGGDARLDGLVGPLTKEAEDAQRRALGLPEANGPSTRRASLVIQAYDELCFPGLAAEWAEQGERRPFVGTLTLELPTDTDDEALSWIAAGTPPIYFGFGSMPIPSPAETVAVISAACAQLGERALVCSGSNQFTYVPHFDHVKVVSAVNHSAVFPACRAVVHHGGAGTTAAGMRAGTPTLILWFSYVDQPIWAAVVERLKIGSGRPFSASTLDSLVADLRSILTPQCVARAREVAAQMTKPAQSVASAADLLEDTAFLGRRGPAASLADH
jgi:UDP:flavonoid glycosyltransferase YjiC (YdhE family)